MYFNTHVCGLYIEHNNNNEPEIIEGRVTLHITDASQGIFLFKVIPIPVIF